MRFLAAAIVTVLVVAAFTVTHHRNAATGHASVVAVVEAARTVPDPPARTVLVARRHGHRPRPTLNWAALARCESGGDWQENSGNGYYGGLQQTVEFWRAWGGLKYAPRADLATRAEQVAVALHGWRVRGAQPWPVCGGLL